MEHGFWSELLDLYKKNKRRIDRELFFRRGSGEERLLEFCTDSLGVLSRPNLCSLALIFFNILGERLPDHIHARMILGESNEHVKEYISANEKYRSRFLWFGTHNPFKNHSLGPDGRLRRMTLK